MPSHDPEVSSSMILGSRGPSATMFSRTAFTLSSCCHRKDLMRIEEGEEEEEEGEEEEE